MRLTEINLAGTGRFLETPAGFECLKHNLPQPWEYIYANHEALLRVRQDGSGYLQASPPGGTPILAGPPLLSREGGHLTPSMFAWIIPEQAGSNRAFGNFFRPTLPAVDPAGEPEEYRCTFTPEAARYFLRHDGWMVETEFWVPPSGPLAVMTVSIKNDSAGARAFTVMPVARFHLAPFTFAPWDVPCWYQTIAFCRHGGKPVFWVETRDPGGNPANRQRAALVTDLKFDTLELSYDKFIGQGQWVCPQAVWDGRLAIPVPAGSGPAFGETGALSLVGQVPLAAMAARRTVAAGETFSFTLVIGKLPDTSNGRLPRAECLNELAKYLALAARREALAELAAKHEKLFSRRTLKAPDACLSRYTNEFLPLQANWVSMLDRGWPSGLRGTRDAAQDATSMLGLDAAHSRRRLLEVYSSQQADGYFPRAYAASGPCSPQPLLHVDAGAWIWEFLWEYLCRSRDFAILKQRTPWSGEKRSATVLEHTLAAFDYYLSNLGRHGLVKIRGGDWNDSINLAGVEGRGETVMVSCQVVLGLGQLCRLLSYLNARQKNRALANACARYAAAEQTLRRNLMRYAYNKLGYFNGVFSDAGQWIFSPRDPDGVRRVSGTANSFAIIAGLVGDSARDKVFAALDTLRCPHGWRLFHPAIGHPPIRNLGRIGQGDLAPGIAENGAPYNHGSHGFLARAAWTAGRGDMFYEVMRHMLPYDQATHPFRVSRTAPYAVVNCWKEAAGLEGVGGDMFLSGSIGVALRNCYDGFAGFRPELEYLVIDPCLPSQWEQLQAEVSFLDAPYSLNIRNPRNSQCGVARLVVNGQVAGDRIFSPRFGRELAVIPLQKLRRGQVCRIEVEMK